MLRQIAHLLGVGGFNSLFAGVMYVAEDICSGV
jgi:hypothetical protein